MTTPDIPRRVSQLRHDVDDVYDLLDITNHTVTSIAGTQRRHGNRLEEIQQALDLTTGRLDRIEDTQRQQFDSLDARLDRIEDTQRQQFDDLTTGRLGSIEDTQRRQFDALDARLGSIVTLLQGDKAEGNGE
ncbi:MAG: hypothetical protein ACRDQ5_14995 [Sciscionella sp.]